MLLLRKQQLLLALVSWCLLSNPMALANSENCPSHLVELNNDARAAQQEYLMTEALRKQGDPEVLFSKLPVPSHAKEDLFLLLQTSEGRNFVHSLMKRLQLISESKNSPLYWRHAKWEALAGDNPAFVAARSRQVRMREAYERMLGKIFKRNSKEYQDVKLYSEAEQIERLAFHTNNWLGNFNNNQDQNGKTLEILILRAKEILGDQVAFPTAGSQKQAIKNLLDKTSVTSQFTPSLAGPIDNALQNHVPYYGVVMNAIQSAGRAILGGELKTMEYVLTDKATKVLREVSTANRRIRISPDLELESTALKFLETYSGKTAANMDERQFLNDLTYAYPEMFVMRNSLCDRSATACSVEGSYGPYSNEFYRVTNRIRFTLGLIRGDKNYFPHLSDDLFQKMRSDILQNNDLLAEDGVSLNFQNVDTLISFLMSDTIGRADNYIIQELDRTHNFKKRFGNDFEKIANEIIETYPLASQSLARQKPQEFYRAIQAYQLLSKVNLGQPPFLESGPYSFASLQGIDQQLVGLAMARYKLTVASIPIANPNVSFLWKENLATRIQLLEEHLVALSKAKDKNVSEHYWDYARQLAKMFNIEHDQLKSSSDLVALRLAVMTRSEDPGQVQKYFNLAKSTLSKASDFSDFNYTLPFSHYFAPDTFLALEKSFKLLGKEVDGDPSIEAFKLWMKWLQDISKQAEQSPLGQGLKNEEAEALLTDVKRHGEYRIYYEELKNKVLGIADKANVANGNLKVITELESKISVLQTTLRAGERQGVSVNIFGQRTTVSIELSEQQRIEKTLELRSLQEKLDELKSAQSSPASVYKEAQQIRLQLKPVDRGFNVSVE